MMRGTSQRIVCSFTRSPQRAQCPRGRSRDEQLEIWWIKQLAPGAQAAIQTVAIEQADSQGDAQ
jgi:hypothetical protein